MSENTQPEHPWGLDFSAPPSQKRVGWGAGADQAPAPRSAAGSAPLEAPLMTPQWAPIVAPGTEVEVELAVDVDLPSPAEAHVDLEPIAEAHREPQRLDIEGADALGAPAETSGFGGLFDAPAQHALPEPASTPAPAAQDMVEVEDAPAAPEPPAEEQEPLAVPSGQRLDLAPPPELAAQAPPVTDDGVALQADTVPEQFSEMETTVDDLQDDVAQETPPLPEPEPAEVHTTDAHPAQTSSLEKPAGAHPDMPSHDTQAARDSAPEDEATMSEPATAQAPTPTSTPTSAPLDLPAPTKIAGPAEDLTSLVPAPAPQAPTAAAPANLPVVVAPAPAEVVATAQPTNWGDLFEQPGTPGAELAHPAPAVPDREALTGASFATRRAALDAAAAQGRATETVQLNDISAQRFLRSDELHEHVKTVVAVGASGDPEVQAVINSLELTRDRTKDAAQRQAYEQALMPLLQRSMVSLGAPEQHRLVMDMAYDEMIGIGPLGPLWRDDRVTEIMVSGPNKVTVERNGRLQPTPVRFQDSAHLERTARDLSSRVDDRSVSRSNPLVTAQLPGARVQFVARPLAATAGTIIVIRKFMPLLGLSDLLAGGSMSEEMASFLCDAVTARATLLVSGGTGSGKTTMINALSSFIPDTERVITIEDALELQLSNIHVESLLTKEAASGDDTVLIDQASLLHASLRMRPDRIVVGEIRDGKGCNVMLQAANTGHDGTMTTIHANSPDLAIGRMSNLLREHFPTPVDVARAQVTSAIDLVVQVVRVRGRRFISAISLVDPGRDTTTTLFTGSFPAGAQHPVFTRVAALGSDTDLAHKMVDMGLDSSPWEATP